MPLAEDGEKGRKRRRRISKRRKRRRLELRIPTKTRRRNHESDENDGRRAGGSLDPRKRTPKPRERRAHENAHRSHEEQGNDENEDELVFYLDPGKFTCMAFCLPSPPFHAVLGQRTAQATFALRGLRFSLWGSPGPPPSLLLLLLLLLFFCSGSGVNPGAVFFSISASSFSPLFVLKTNMFANG